MAKFTKEKAMKDLAHAKKLINGFNLAKQFSTTSSQDNPILYIFVKYIELQNVSKVSSTLNEVGFRIDEKNFTPSDISDIIQSNYEPADVNSDIQYLARYIFASNKKNVNARYN